MWGLKAVTKDLEKRLTKDGGNVGHYFGVNCKERLQGKDDILSGEDNWEKSALSLVRGEAVVRLHVTNRGVEPIFLAG